MYNLLLKGEFGKDITLDGVKSAIPNEIEDGINVIIDSIGGNLFEAIKVTDYLKGLGVPLKATAIKVASAATWPFFQIDDRTIDFTQAKEDWLFIHEARLNPADMGKATLSADDLRAIADRVDQFNQMLVDLYASSLGISKSKAAKLMTDETWINQTEAEELQIVALLNPKEMGVLQTLIDGVTNLNKLMADKGIVASEVVTMKTKDGLAIKTESLSVGESISIVKDGVEERYENGVLQLEDGRYVIVQWGNISYIIGETVQSEAIEAVAARVQASLPAAEGELQTDADPAADPATDFEAMYKEAMAKVEALQAECDGYKAKMTEQESQIGEQIEAIKAIEARLENVKIADIATTNALPVAKPEANQPLDGLQELISREQFAAKAGIVLN